jgi:hypothetical protein
MDVVFVDDNLWLDAVVRDGEHPDGLVIHRASGSRGRC